MNRANSKITAAFPLVAMFMLSGCDTSKTQEYVMNSPEGQSLLEFCGSQNERTKKSTLPVIFDGLEISGSKLDVISRFGNADVEVEVSNLDTGRLVSRTLVYVGSSEKFCNDSRSGFVAIYMNDKDSIVSIDLAQDETKKTKGMDGLKEVERYVRF